MDIQDKKVTVVGMGRTALALVKLLLDKGAAPFVSDSGSAEALAPFTRELDGLWVPWECGGHSEAAFEGSSLVIPSPGVPPTAAPIERAREEGVAVMGEMEFASRFCASKILAVTGTNGKTTTTELLRTLVAACGHEVLLAGNNDTPLSAAALEDPAPAYIVLEVSSYQLELAQTFRPFIGAVLNLTPDHLARHGTMEEYARVKGNLFARQRPGDVAVVNRDDPWLRAMRPPEGVERREFSLETRLDEGLWLDGDAIRLGDAEVASVSDTRLKGRHNLQNVLAALSVMRAGGFDWERTLEGLRSFEGVEHRIEYVATVHGAAFYNDSKSTNIDSLKVALDSFDTPVVLIAGGEGKGADYGVLEEAVARHVKALVTLGQDAPLLEEAFGGVVACERAADMDDAVRRGLRAASPGDAVLLSPACASFDMYENFEHRGRVFKESVRRIEKEAMT